IHQPPPPSVSPKPQAGGEVFPGANALRRSMEGGTPRDSIDLDLERGIELEKLRAKRAAARKTTSAGGGGGGDATSRPETGVSPIPEEGASGGDNDDGSDGDGDGEDEWDGSHPCFPHKNPHVPSGDPRE